MSLKFRNSEVLIVKFVAIRQSINKINILHEYLGLKLPQKPIYFVFGNLINYFASKCRTEINYNTYW